MVYELLILALIIGLLMKGRIERLLDVQIKSLWLIGLVILLMVVARILKYRHVIEYPSFFFGTERVAELLLVCGFAAANIKIPGAKLLLAGLLLNAIAVAANGGAGMPVSYDCILTVWGKKGAHEYLKMYPQARHMFISAGTRLPWLCDIIPIRRPFVVWQGVFSAGDLVSSLGCMIGIVSIMRTPLASEKKTAVEEP